MEKINISILDEADNDEFSIKLPPSLMIRQVKLDIHRTKYVGARMRGVMYLVERA